VPILIDGNNLMHRLPGSERSRGEGRRLTLARSRRERMKVVLVFDGPPPAGVPEREELGSLTVLYSGTASADERIVAAATGPTWVVVTDDRALAARVRQAGAEVRPLATWMEPRPAARAGRSRVTAEPPLSSRDVADWEAFFKAGKPREE
jgi:hypothetical protein